MNRIYLPPDVWKGGKVVLSGPEAHHLIHVLRAAEGTRVTCFDGLGREADGVVARVARRDVEIAIGSPRIAPAAAWELTVAVAVPRHAKLEQIIDQATQLGVSRIVPLMTARGVVRITGDAAGRKRARWAQAAVVAGKQSGASRLPEIDGPVAWADFLPEIRKFDRALIASIEGPHERIEKLLGREVKRAAVIVGPEGDFTPEETGQAVAAGARRVSLGPQVLRVDTAVLSAAVLAAHFLRSAHEAL